MVKPEPEAPAAAEPEGLFDAAPAAAPLPLCSTVERAFELARGGTCTTIDQICDQLKAERRESVEELLFEDSIRKALRQACAEARQGYARARGIDTALARSGL